MRVERVIRELSSVDTQRRLRRTGLRVTEGGVIGGQLRPLADIFEDAASNPRLQTSAQRQRVFREVRALEGFEVLQQQARLSLAGDPRGLSLRGLENIDRGEGRGIIEDAFSEISDTSFFRLRQIGTGSTISTINDADRIINSYAQTVSQLTELQDEFPLLTESMDTSTPAS